MPELHRRHIHCPHGAPFGGEPLAIVQSDSNIARMVHRRESAIIISAIYHLPEVIDQADTVISVLGQSDKLQFPEVGSREVLRLTFDDTVIASKTLIPANREHIAELIEFARRWNGVGTLLVHCRAGSSRSPAAAMIAAAALGWPDSAELVVRIRTARAYFRPNEAMLKLADSLLGTIPGLVDLSRSVPITTRTDNWKPVRVPLNTFNQS